jgi:D-alanine-D-alanine ligase
MGCADVARIDFRLDANDGNKPYILEINPLPGLNPEYSDLCIEAKADGWHYDQLINRILDEAIQRYGLRTQDGSDNRLKLPLAQSTTGRG